MYRNIYPGLFFALIVLLLLAGSLTAEVPNTISYQGLLKDNAGDPVADGLYDVVFRIYDATSTTLWEESHQVATQNGFFTVQLGSNGSPLTSDIFNHAECWLGLTVGTDAEITPRTLLNSTPYAFKAGLVEAGSVINGPGVAAYSGAFYVFLNDNDYITLCSLTINCPARGYVMAIAHGRIATLPEHTMGTKSYAVVGISDTPNSLPGNQDLDYQIDSLVPTGVYSTPFGMTSMFTVPSAGAYTYYYLAYEYSGSVSVADMQFNLVYYPTAYGNVGPVPPPVKSSESEDFLTSGTQSQSEGRDVSGIEEVEQIKRELAALKERIETIQQSLGSGKTVER